MQNELLAKYAKANLRAYVIWFNMYPGDERSKWPPNLLTDVRVIHRWDEPKAVGLWYAPTSRRNCREAIDERHPSSVPWARDDRVVALRRSSPARYR